jgi:PAS domain-containing protein
MSPKAIEMILARQLASYLALPIMIYDLQGTLVFYNESAEPIAGQRFEESGEILVVDLRRIFHVRDEKGKRVPTDASPHRIALFERRPAYNRVWIRGLDGVRRHIEISAVPLTGQADRFLGVMGLLWEISE